jgi:hypothetical protein
MRTDNKFLVCLRAANCRTIETSAKYVCRITLHKKYMSEVRETELADRSYSDTCLSKQLENQKNMF